MHRIFNRRTLAYAILGLWIVVLGFHVRREYFKPLATRLAERARSLNPGTFFYTIKMNGQAIGYAESRLDTIAGGFVFNDRVILDVPALDELHRAVAQTRIELGPAMQLTRFSFQLGSEIGEYLVKGEVRNDSVLDLELNPGTGQLQRTSLAIDPDLLLDAAIPMRMAAAGQLEVGQVISARVFNPSVMDDQLVEMRVTAHDTIILPDSARYNNQTKKWEVSSLDTVPAWRVDQAFGGISISNWVDEDGHLIKAESPVGYTLERMPYEIADQDWKRSQQEGTLSSGYGAVIERTAISANVDLSTVTEAPQLRVRLGGVDLRGFDLAGGRQSLTADTLTIRREAESALVSNYRLPYARGGPVAEELEATGLIQARDPAIVKQAKEIAAGSNDPGVVARRLYEWVYRNLKKDITLSVPSAVQVLQARQGDCNEHTVLYVALARALGLPTRSAAGLVHLRGRFYYHAWPEVWLGRDWVAVDPTLGQYPADASHLRFIVGGLARQVELIRLIGKLQLEVV